MLFVFIIAEIKKNVKGINFFPFYFKEGLYNKVNYSIIDIKEVKK